MKNLQVPEIWFITGSQHLYGEQTLEQVAAHSRQMVEELNASERLPLKLVIQPVLTRPEEIRALCLRANNEPNCGGLILWMHTFSPSKMWIGGLRSLIKPFLHLHTQFNRDLPWGEIDMDFMNLNQSAHGDREAGFIHTRLRLNRKVVVGHWSDAEVQDRSQFGCERTRPGTIGRALSLSASVTTCATSRSPRAIKSRRKRSLVIR